MGTKTRTTKAKSRRRHLAPAAARVGDHHVCGHVTEGVVHAGGQVLMPAAETVLFGVDQEQAARVGDLCWCDGGAYDVIEAGEATVLIGKRPAARRGDATAGGYLAAGDSTILVGQAGRGAWGHR